MAGGAPLGNNNAGKAKLWTHAITKALEKKTKKEGVEALAVLAMELIDKVQEGDMTAIKELGDRIEGKPTMVLGGDPDSPLEIKTIERVIVHPPNTDS